MKNNIGVIGPDSLRLKGMKIEELPIAEGAQVQSQMPAFWKTEEENEIGKVRAKYPTQSIAWIDGAVRECESNIKNIHNLISSQNTMIGEYNGYISLCKHRDKVLKKLDPEKDVEEIKATKKQFPLYDVKAMKTQIQLCNEAIFRSNEVIEKEHKSISELRDLRVQCVARDTELRKLGVTV